MHVEVEHGEDGIGVALRGLVVVVAAVRLDRAPDELLLEDEVGHGAEVEELRVALHELRQEELDRVVVLRLRVEERERHVEHLRRAQLVSVSP